MDLFAFIRHADPTKVKVGDREAHDGEVPMLEMTMYRVVPLAGVYDHENSNVQDAGNDDVNAGVNDVVKAGQAEQGDCVVDIGVIEIVVNDEIQAIITDLPNRIRMRRKATDGAGGSGLLERGTLAAEVGVTAAAIVPFVTSFVTPTLEHEGGGAEILRLGPSSVPGLLQKGHPCPPPLVLTLAVTTTVVPGATSVSNIINNFVLDDPNVCRGIINHLAPLGFFSRLWAMNYEQLLAKYIVGVARQACFSAKVRMRLDQELRGRQKLEERYAHQEVEAAKVICLRDQIATIEAAKATRITKLNILKERNVSLEGQVATLEFAVVSKDAEIASSQPQIAKLTHDLSGLQLSCDVLSVKASPLEFEKDKLVSGLEVTCSGLREEVMRYKLFKEWVEEMQDEKIKDSDRVAAIDSDLMEMVLHMDAKFYPCYLTTIAGRKWILSRGLRLMLANCLASPGYLFVVGEDKGRAIDKGMQDGLIAGIEHGRVGRGIADVVVFNPFVEGDYIAAINALRDVNFPLLDQLEANKDSSMVDIMDLLRLEGPWGRNRSPPVSIKYLTGEASSFVVLAIAVITALSTMFSQTDPVPLVLSTEVPPSPKIIFEEEELDTKLEHVLAP
nr:hypothetical protein [Tanacetum cinerariifolium]